MVVDGFVDGLVVLQAKAEVVVSRKFLENFTGDQVRFLARGFTVPGDHAGQQTMGVRFPYGSVGLITPFNFPLEIPVLQLMGALYMGNKVRLKSVFSHSRCFQVYYTVQESSRSMKMNAQIG